MNFLRNNKTVEKLFLVANQYKPSGQFFPLSISEFDIAMDGGFRDGELVVISGETGNGKTLWAQTMTCQFNKVGVPSLWFSFEMSPYYLKNKFVQMRQTIDDPIYSPIKLIDGDLKFIEQEIKEAKEDRACKFVFIDHLHYLIPLKESSNSSLFIGGIVRTLKQMAIRNNVVIVLIAHTKKIYQGEELDLSSVRDSSLVCQEADYVFLVNREKKVGIVKKLEISKLVQNEWTNKTKINLVKNRRTGKMFSMKLQYQDGMLIPITQNYGKI